MRSIFRLRWALLILFLTGVGCQPKEKSLTDWLNELPKEYTLLENSTLDSLIQFEEYLDPNGDSLEQIKYEFKQSGNTAEINFTFTTGQRGFRNQQFKLIDKNHLIICTTSGSPWNSFIDQLTIFELKDNKISETSNEVLSKILTNHDYLSLSREEELNGITGCDFFTEHSNTVRMYYLRGTDGKETKDKEAILEWTGSEFKVHGK